MSKTNEKIEEINRLWNSYFIPGTETLANKLNIVDKEELKQREAEITFEKLVELYENPILGDFDAQHLKDIHKYLFEDIYQWAGEYRYVNIRKETDFLEYDKIEHYLSEEIRLMHEELKDVDSKNGMAEFLASYYVHLIAIHPFREGNGRSCREFLRQLVAAKSKELPCGPLELDWTEFNGETFMENLQFSFVFRSAIESEFYKTLKSPTELQNINKTH